MVKGCGRYIPRQPYSDIVYSRIHQRDKASLRILIITIKQLMCLSAMSGECMKEIERLGGISCYVVNALLYMVCRTTHSDSQCQF